MIYSYPFSDPPGEQRYRHLFEHVPVCILVADTRSSPALLLDANRRASQMYGYSCEELAGMPAWQLVPSEAQDEVRAMVQAARQGIDVTIETLNCRRDGSVFPVRLTAALDPLDEARILLAVEDITAEKQRRSEAEAIDLERRRIAREIHDGVAQTLAGLRLKSQLWQFQGDQAPPGMVRALDEMQTLLNDAIVDLRRAIYALRPLDLETGGFFTALARLAREFGEQNHLDVRLEAPQPPQGASSWLPARYELPLFRIIQEGLHNISQHARARAVRISLSPSQGGVALEIVDDGKGFDPARLPPAHLNPHLGLWQMRERVLELGGAFEARSAPEQGTHLLIYLPPAAPERLNAAG